MNRGFSRRVRRGVSSAAAAVLLFLWMVCISVSVTLNFRPLYYLDMKLLDISGNSGYSEAVIRENYDALIAYNNIWYRGELSFPSLPMSEAGRIHFEEVKQIFGLFEWGCLLLAPAVLLMIVRMRKKKQSGYLAAAGWMAVGLPAGIGVGIAVCWEQVFVRFHELVFQNDFWLFDPKQDPVILILPDAFFLHCAVLILLLMAAGSLCCLLAWRRAKKR